MDQRLLEGPSSLDGARELLCRFGQATARPHITLSLAPPSKNRRAEKSHEIRLRLGTSSHHHTYTSHRMAKGLRSSRNKKNNQTLSKRVFAPVEAARNERLSAKLLALAQEAKAPKEEMDIEKGTQKTCHRHLETATDMISTETADKDSGAAAEGTPSLSIPIPKSIASPTQLLTPPSTPPSTQETSATPILDGAGQLVVAEEQLFYHLLGASTDIMGFNEAGDLCLSFNTSSPSSDT